MSGHCNRASRPRTRSGAKKTNVCPVYAVREQWRVRMRRAGVSERDCEAIRSAFLYDGLFYENAG